MDGLMARKVWRITKLAGLSFVVLILITSAGSLAYRAYRHYQLARTTPIDETVGIDEAFFAPIGGIDQWISIRGQNRNNPVILILHGGPGFALSPMPRNFFYYVDTRVHHRLLGSAWRR